jgi:hypothetical protein
MTTKTQEIQQLLAAEKRAAETVSEARKSTILVFCLFYFFNFKKSLQFVKEKQNVLGKLKMKR